MYNFFVSTYAVHLVEFLKWKKQKMDCVVAEVEKNMRSAASRIMKESCQKVQKL